VAGGSSPSQGACQVAAGLELGSRLGARIGDRGEHLGGLVLIGGGVAIATAFDQAAFPGPPDPWGHAITPSQECALWKKTAPQLGSAGLDAIWLFGGSFDGYEVPNWTGTPSATASSTTTGNIIRRWAGQR
jgi:hypothetical protein